MTNSFSLSYRAQTTLEKIFDISFVASIINQRVINILAPHPTKMAFRYNVVVRIYFVRSIFAGKPAMIHEINLRRLEEIRRYSWRHTRDELYRLHGR